MGCLACMEHKVKWLVKQDKVIARYQTKRSIEKMGGEYM